MQHQQAVDSKAPERYLLGEMSEPERFEFEAHYFDCPVCADEVRAGDALARALKAVGAEELASRPKKGVLVEMPRRKWLPAVAPSAIAACFACVVAWQSLVTIPGLRWAASPQASAPIALRAAARGEEQSLSPKAGSPFTLFSLDVNSADPGVPLTYELIAPGGAVRHQAAAIAPPAGSPLIVVVPNSTLREPGAWELRLLDAHRADLARYPFSVDLH